jgi:hypothetical protein
MRAQEINLTIPTHLFVDTNTDSQLLTQIVQYSVAAHLKEVLETMISQNAAAASERTQVAARAVPQVKLALLAGAYPLNDPRVHYLDTYSLWDNTIELHDGSLWRVNSFDMHKILNWASNDVLSLTYTDFFFGEKYKISNTMTGDSVLVDLLDGPVRFGPNTHWVIGIDHFLGRVYLEDGTYWDVRFMDKDLLSQWALNDTIILGDSKVWWNDAMLINVNMNHTVHASKGF